MCSIIIFEIPDVLQADSHDEVCEGKSIIMRKTIYLLPVGMLLIILSAAGMAKVNAGNQYTRDFYQDTAYAIRSREEGFPAMQGDTPDASDAIIAAKEMPDSDKNINASKEPGMILGDYLLISDTDICYPLVQGNDNQYYLNHLPNGEKSNSGSIFIDCQNHFTEDFNVIIYGHNMRNGTMFGTLHDFYREASFAKEHSELIICYDDERYRYELFSVRRVEYESDVYEIDPEDKALWIQSQKQNSAIKTDVEADKDDKFVTLSTCGKTETEKVVTIWKRL